MAFASNTLALVALLLLTTGCLTGELIQSARMHERVRTYDRIAIVDQSIRLNYTSEIRSELPDEGEDSDPMAIRAVRQRGATFVLSELTVRPEHPVDKFPLRRVAFGSAEGQALPVTISNEATQSEQTLELDHSPTSLDANHTPTWEAHSSGLIVRIDERRGKQQGFRVCSTNGAPCLGYFYSAALHDAPVAWWAYPVAPFTFVLDVVLTPFQIVTLPIMIALGD